MDAHCCTCFSFVGIVDFMVVSLDFTRRYSLDQLCLVRQAVKAGKLGLKNSSAHRRLMMYSIKITYPQVVSLIYYSIDENTLVFKIILMIEYVLVIYISSRRRV